MTDGPAPLHLHPTALAAEDALLAELDGLLESGAQGVGLPPGPVRVVVPSTALRQHLLARIPAHRGRAALGLSVQTLAGLAASVLQDAGERPGHADPILPVLVARQGREQPALAEVLGGIRDGWAAAVSPVVSLLDAGFVGDRDAVPLARMIQELPPEVSSVEEQLRAIALVAVAAGVQQDLNSLGLRRGGDALRAAAARVHLGGGGLARTHRILLHGLADLSPPELELVDALVRTLPASLHLVAPPEPGALARGDGRADGGSEDARVLAERLGSAARVVRSEVQAPAPALVRRRAPGRTAEARDLARQVRAALDAGVPAEAIGLVVRDPASHVLRLRPELERLGVPYSGVGAAAPPGPALRRLRALLDLWEQGERTPVHRWLDALGRLKAAPQVPVADLRTGLSALGCTRLGEVATLDLDARLGAEAKAFALPVRTGVVATGESEDPAPREEVAGAVARRRLPRFALDAAVAAARQALAHLADDRPRTLAVWGDHARSLTEEALGWGAPEPAWRAMDAAVSGLAERVDAALELDGVEALLLLGPALSAAALGPAGGAGGGVQLLSAVEARGRTFSLLLVAGLSRGELPRRPRPDPLLPDRLRLRLRSLLPDLATDGARRRVEAALLPHLLGASPDVRLSWPGVDDDGKTVAPSSAVERLALALGEEGVVDLPVPGSRQDPPEGLRELARPLDEHARVRAAHGAPDELAPVLALALAGGGDDAAVRAGEVGAARLAARDELDLPPGKAGPGPLLGLVGPAAGRADPRHGPLFVTTLEGVARCGWQAFLTRALRLTPPPDPGGQLPEADHRLVGMVVHAVLEEIVGAALATAEDRSAAALDPSLAAARQRAPVRAPWPAADALAALVEAEARRVSREEGLALPGMWRVLAARSAAHLETARSLEWAEGGGPDAVGIEVQGQVEVPLPEGPMPVAFRADRVDRGADGALVLTDYKTGRPVSTAKRAGTRARHLLVELRAGRRLQGAAYALAEAGAVGRYLSLAPDLGDTSDEARAAAVPDEADGTPREAWVEALAGVVDLATRAWRGGALLPRLTDAHGDKTPAACSYCTVRLACAQGDSTARQRLARWAAAPERVDAEATVPPVALGLWWLGETP